MSTLKKTKKLRRDLYVNTVCIAELYLCKWSSAIEHSLVSVQHLRVKCEKIEY